MKKWYYGAPVKLVAMALASFSLLATVVAAGLVIGLGSEGYYAKSDDEIRQEMYRNLASNYSAQILDNAVLESAGKELSGSAYTTLVNQHFTSQMWTAKEYAPYALYEDSTRFSYGVVKGRGSIESDIFWKNAKWLYQSPNFTPKSEAKKDENTGDAAYDGYFEGEDNGDYYYDTTSTMRGLLRDGWYREAELWNSAPYSDFIKKMIRKSDLLCEMDGDGYYLYTADNGKHYLFVKPGGQTLLLWCESYYYDSDIVTITDTDSGKVAMIDEYADYDYEGSSYDVQFAFTTEDGDYNWPLGYDDFTDDASLLVALDDLRQDGIEITTTGDDASIYNLYYDFIAKNRPDTYYVIYTLSDADTADVSAAETAVASATDTATDENAGENVDNKAGEAQGKTVETRDGDGKKTAVADPASLMDAHFAEADKDISHILWLFHHTALIITLCLLVLIASVAYLAVSCGRRPDGTKGKLRAIDRFPFELYLIAVAAAEVGGWYGIFAGAEYGFSAYPFGLCVFLGLFAGTVLMFFVIALLLSFEARLKAKSFWKTTLLYPFGRWIWRVLKKIFGFFAGPFKEAHGKRSLFWKTVAVLMVLTIVEALVLIYAFDWWQPEFAAAMFVIYVVLEFVFVLYIVMHLSKIRDGAHRVASGDLHTPIDTRRMKGEIRHFAEDVNNVGVGISAAVSEQMKSERMKTELITNVSHDIKTPLTSIINYVDLLQKEDIDNPKAAEYMEVLARQSARLKKLIEDLIEASKAQTGNLEVHREKCDTTVLLSQVLGEYEERFSQAELSVETDRPDKPVYVMADGRYLFRIFDNLLNNICKYAQGGTRVYVDVVVRDSRVNFTFKNISREKLNISDEELTERFVRGDSSRNTEGSGLGLSIARSLTEIMDGTMTLKVDGDLFKVVISFPVG